MYSFMWWQNNINHVFPSKRCISNEKNVVLLHFYDENHTTYQYINCNKKILFVKKNILAYCRHSSTSPFSCCFLNTNTAITRQLLRTARILEAEWWQVCGETWVRGRRKMSQTLGAFGLLDFTMSRPILAWRSFWNFRNVYFFNFPIFSRPQ